MVRSVHDLSTARDPDFPIRHCCQVFRNTRLCGFNTICLPNKPAAFSWQGYKTQERPWLTGPFGLRSLFFALFPAFAHECPESLQQGVVQGVEFA